MLRELEKTGAKSRQSRSLTWSQATCLHLKQVSGGSCADEAALGSLGEVWQLWPRAGGAHS